MTVEASQRLGTSAKRPPSRGPGVTGSGGAAGALGGSGGGGTGGGMGLGSMLEGTKNGTLAPISVSDSSRPRTGRSSRRKHAPPTHFAVSIARTVDVLRGDVDGHACQDVRRILADIRKHYDDVHCEAERKEEELLRVRREIHLMEAEAEKAPPESFEFASLSLEDLQKRLGEVTTEYRSACETQRVYRHMVSRLRREAQLVQQKVTIMQEHLRRKTHEVEKRQQLSRRVHQEKVACIERLEDVETEIEQEREICAAALEDLDEAARQKRSEVNHRKEFEDWRYEIALDAANEAFQATAGRYRKIYAVEKLCGNCLQKHTFEQAEQSQATEDGFQKIREVTGLTDVTDIVTKFLNREQEHDQLRLAVREAEVRLHSLREAESARHGEGAQFDHADELPTGRGIIAEAAMQEQEMMEAENDFEQLQIKIKKDMLLLDSIVLWGQKARRSLSALEDLPRIESQPDIVPYFTEMAQVVERFFRQAHEDKTPQQLSKLASQAATKEYTEQMKLMGDKEFLRLNLRVPSTLDQRAPEEKKKGPAPNEEERQEQEHELERERVKDEAARKLGDRSFNRNREVRERETRPRSRAAGAAATAAAASSGAAGGHGGGHSAAVHAASGGGGTGGGDGQAPHGQPGEEGAGNAGRRTSVNPEAVIGGTSSEAHASQAAAAKAGSRKTNTPTRATSARAPAAPSGGVVAKLKQATASASAAQPPSSSR